MTEINANTPANLNRGGSAPLLWKLLIALLVVAVLTGTAFLVLRLGKLQTVPAAAWYGLRSPQQMTLYSLRPEESAEAGKDTAIFHGYRIVGQVTLSKQADQAAVAQTIQRAVLAARGEAACFNPRFGIRVTSEHSACDFVISFECRRLDYYIDNVTVGHTAVAGSDEAFAAIFQEANAPRGG